MSETSSGVSLYEFAAIAGARIRTTGANISLAVLVANGIFKMYFKTMGTERNKYRKIVLLAVGKVNSIGKLKCKQPANAEISHKEFNQ